MKNQLFTLGLMASLCVSSVNATMTRAQVEQIANNADKIRIAQNIVAPAALIACDFLNELLSLSAVNIATGVNQGVKNTYMMAQAALETDASVVAEVSDVLSTLAFADRIHVLIGAAITAGSSPILRMQVGRDGACEISKTLTITAVSQGVTRIVAEVASVFICRKVNNIIKEKYKGASSMVQRRVLRTLTIAMTKTVAHMLTIAVTTLAVQSARGMMPVPDFTCFDLDVFIRDTILPVIGYAAAEFSGHILAQELIAAEATVAA